MYYFLYKYENSKQSFQIHKLYFLERTKHI